MKKKTDIKPIVSTKSNNLLDAGFFKFLNSMEMRVFNLAISRLNPMRPVTQSRRFVFTVKEFLEHNPGIVDRTSVYDNVRNAVLNLGKVWVPVQPLEGDDNAEISLLTYRSYSKGQGRFVVEFHEMAMPYLVEIKNNYTSLTLDTFGALKSEYSLKMYEFLNRWAFKGRVSIKVDELKVLLNVVEMYDRWNNFNQWVLKPAIKEINAKTNLGITLKTIRTGRAITDLEFQIFDRSKAIPVEEPKRPKFPHKNKYGRFVKLDVQNPKMSSHEYGLWAMDCLKVLNDFYKDIAAITTEDLRHFIVFLSCGDSFKSPLGKKLDFVNELKKRGYKLVDCELVKLEEKQKG